MSISLNSGLAAAASSLQGLVPPPQANGSGRNSPVDAAAFSSEPFYIGSNVMVVLSALSSSVANFASGITFAEVMAGTEPIPADRDMAAISQDVYGTEITDPSDLNGWQRVSALPDPVIQELGLEEEPDGTLYNKETGIRFDPATGLFTGPMGLQAGLYQRGDEFVLAYAGTGSLEDWMNNGLHAGGGPGGQHEAAIGLGIGIDQGLARAGHEGSLVFTGHSLGGGLASLSSFATGAPAVTFNAAGVRDNSFFMFDDGSIDAALRARTEAYGEAPTLEEAKDASMEGQIRAYHVDGEVLYLVQEHAGHAGLVLRLIPHPAARVIGTALLVLDHAPGSAGQRIAVENHDGGAVILDSLDRHSMDSMVGSLDATVPKVLGDSTDADGNIVVTVGDSSVQGSFDQAGGDLSLVRQAIASDDRHARGAVVTSVVFADSPQGRASADYFRRTGTLPPDNSGVLQVTTVARHGDVTVMEQSVANDTPSIADDGKVLIVDVDAFDGAYQQHMVFRADGTVESVSTTAQWEDGAILVIEQQFDEAGVEAVDDRRYVMTYVDWNGDTVTRSFNEEEMGALMHLAGVAHDGGNLPLLDTVLDRDGSPVTFEGTFGFAMSLARAEARDSQRGMDDYLLAISQHGDGDGDGRTMVEIPGEVRVP